MTPETAPPAPAWARVALYREAGPPLAGLEGLSFGPPRAVLGPGAPGHWDDFGVRDPAILMDARGRPVREDRRLVWYDTGSTEGGRLQASGRLVSHDGGPVRRIAAAVVR